MKRVRVPKGTKIPTFWSVSRYQKWRGCAYQYLLECILKFRGAPSRASERGVKIHKLFEELLKGNITGMPNELKLLSPEIKNLTNVGGSPEQDWTLTKDLQKTHPKDWDGAWLRAKLDAHHYWEDDKELLIVDLKTGKPNIAQAQMDLYAGMSPFYYPEAEDIRVELWFSDVGEIHGQNYNVKECKELWNKWVRRAKDMLEDRKWLPNPGAACRKYGGCPMRSDKTLEDGRPGPCHEWKTKK